MAGLFDKAKDLANSEQGEQVSDSLLEKGAEAGGHATGGKFDAQIEQGREQADKRIGTE